MHSGSCRDRISMWFRECEMNRSDGSIFLDKDRVFKRSPVTRFYAMFFWSRFCMFTWDDRLVIHTLVLAAQRRNSKAISNFTGHVTASPFHRSFRTSFSFRPSPFASPIATKCCCIQMFLPEMKCSPMRSLCLSSVGVFAVTSPLMSLCSKVVDNVVYEVDCATITVKEGDVDIGLSFFFFLLLDPASKIFP